MAATKSDRPGEAEIAKVGVKAIEQAHAVGVAAHYIDESLGDGLVKEMPDGTRQLIDSSNG
jgi:stage V sporulation protein SpoVS